MLKINENDNWRTMNFTQKPKRSSPIFSFAIFFLFLLSLTFISAGLGTFEQGECVDIKTILNSSSVTLSTLSYPNGSIGISEETMTNVAGKTFNYTFCNTREIGKYNYDYYDANGEVYVNSFEITTNEISSNDTAGQIRFGILMLICIIITILIFMKVSKMFGSMLVFAIGLGMLRADAQNGWMGWIVMCAGFLMLIYALIEKPKRR